MLEESGNYYRCSFISKIGLNLALRVRHEMFDLFIRKFPPNRVQRILDLGVTSEEDPTANILERLHPHPGSIVCAGVQQNDWIESAYPGVKFVKIEPGKPLPFEDCEFDVVYSSAVIEHVGTRADQAAFLKEALRVANGFFITTPNRWFPIEMHTHIPLLHYLPQKVFRYLLSLFGEFFYSRECNLNLLGRGEFISLFPDNVITSSRYGWAAGFPSNIVIYGSRKVKVNAIDR